MRDICIDFYENEFNPLNPSENQIKESNENTYTPCRIDLIYHLQKEITYILVITTSNQNIFGSFAIVAIGPNNVTLKRNGEFYYMDCISCINYKFHR